MPLRQNTLVLAIALCLPLGALWMGAARAESIDEDTGGFDLKQLEQSGYSADVARFFAREARFMPGTHAVSVSINAGVRRELALSFNGEGMPCFSPVVVAQLGLRAGQQDDAEGCTDLATLFPGSQVALRPGSMQIDLTVPQTAFAQDGGDDLQRGGSAFLLNYDLFAQRFHSRSASRGSFSARLEGGINVASWALRSRGDYSQRNGTQRYVQQETYAQRPLEGLGALLQVGELTTVSDGFGGVPIWGAQLISDNAQARTQPLAVPIQGIAETNATVEIRQRGTLVYRTVVAPGPYVIENVGAIRRGTDIEVVLIEEDGRQSKTVVPAPMAQVDEPQPATFRFGMGRYRARSGEALVGSAPWLVYGDHAFDMFAGTRVTSSFLLAHNYRGAGVQTSLALTDDAWLGVGGRVSHSNGRGLGAELQLQGTARLGAGISGGVSWQLRDSGFSTFEDSLPVRDAQQWPHAFQQSFGTSLSWSHPRWGSLSYGASYSRDGGQSAVSHTLSAARRFGKVSSNLTLQKAQGKGYAAFVSVQVPLGDSTVSTRGYRYANGSQSVGASYSSSLGRDGSYQLDASRSDSSQRISGTVRAQTAYGSVSAGLSQTGSDTRTAYASLSGGLAAVRGGGFAMSSSRISDTFALVKIPAVSGIRLSGASTARTSWLGTALLPSITPYRVNQIKLDGRTLPLNYRFGTTALDLKLARGAVATHVIAATEIRQLMLNVTLANGGVARLGSALYDAQGEFLGTVVGEGNVILDNEQIGQPVFLDQGGTRCEIKYEAPRAFDADNPYEERDGVCV